MGAKRVRVRPVWVVVAAVAAVAAAVLVPGVASAAVPPFDTNAACLECHSVDLAGAAFTKADFSEPAVDRAVACVRCHWQSIHPVHNPTSQCQSCHAAMPWRTDFYAVNLVGPYGYFMSAESTLADATRLHDIHVNGSWPQNVTERPYYGGSVNCVSCHAPAACDACHAAPVAHGAHSATATSYPAVTRRVTRGIAPADTATDTSFLVTEGCAKAACHDPANADLPDLATIIDDTAGTYDATWWDWRDWSYYQGTFHQTNISGSTAAFTVTGAGSLRVIGDQSPGDGNILVSVDGGPAQRVPCYSPVSMHGVTLFATEVGPGSHLVSITAETWAYGAGYLTVVTLDAVGISSKGAPAKPFVPACASCHADRTTEHGYTSVAHTATVGAVLESGTACSACHSMDLATEHGKATSSSAGRGCSTCHPAPRNTFTAWDRSCSQGGCHTARHAARALAHDASAVGAGCGGTGCHAVSDAAAVHAESVPGNAMHPSCVTCHTSPATLPATLDCSAAGCHAGVVGHRAVHQTAASAECVACHEYANVQDQHAPASIGTTVSGKPNDGCNICHGGDGWTNVRLGSTRECVSCHNAAKVGGRAYSPVDPNHYPAVSHASSETTGCAACHLLDMKSEHARVAVPVSCVTCHETKVDAFTAPWDGMCTARCHSAKHAAQAASHVSTVTACGGAGCHAVGDVSVVHAKAVKGCNTCHVNAAVRVGTTDCLSSGCHAGATPSHKASHDASAVIDPGCDGCHFTNLIDEHTPLGYTCATCHDSANAAVAAAISGHTPQCAACHPAVNGRDFHAAQYSTEFAVTNASGHNSVGAVSYMKSSFTVRGVTYAMSLPSASAFLRSGWTATSRVSCDGCHTFSSALAGPHGAAVTVNIDPAYPTAYSNTILSKTSPGMSAGVICAKCHNLYNNGSYSNIVHKEHDDRGMTEGGRCVSCHIAIPHGWGRPRMLGSTNDPAPYRTVSGGITEIALKNYTPNGWQKSDCYASCSVDRHPDQSNPWPVVAYGTLAGTVTDASGAPLSGAAVTAGTLSAVTGANGAFTLAGVETGSYSVTVSKSGYQAQTKSATVNAGATTSLAFALELLPGTIAGTVTDSATSAKLSGVTVSVVGDGTATTDSNGAYTLANVLAGTRTVTYSRSGYATQTAAVTVASGGTVTRNVALVALSATNLARTGSAAASSQRSGYEADHAIDGSTSTRWHSAGHDTEWLRVDLGSIRSVDKVVVPWYSSYYARSYKVQVSTDGSNWSDVYSTSSGYSGTKTVTFSARTARYVRVYCTYANSESGYSVTELEVWGR